jgi:hypothetical protein
MITQEGVLAQSCCSQGGEFVVFQFFGLFSISIHPGSSPPRCNNFNLFLVPFRFSRVFRRLDFFAFLQESVAFGLNSLIIQEIKEFKQQSAEFKKRLAEIEKKSAELKRKSDELFKSRDDRQQEVFTDGFEQYN